MNVRLSAACGLEEGRGQLCYRVEHMLGLALGIAKSTIQAHLVQVLGQVLLDLYKALEHS